MSLQEFLLAELVSGARTRTPAEVVAEVERTLPRNQLKLATTAGLIRADRDSH